MVNNHSGCTSKFLGENAVHTIHHENVTLHYHGDFSGDVLISVAAAEGKPEKPTQEITVPFSALKSLVATYIQSKLISRLEQASDDQILGLEGD